MKGKLLASLIAVYVIWGSTYLAMRICILDGLPPLQMAGIRYFAAGLTLMLFGWSSGATWPTRREWLRVFPIGGLYFLGGNGLIAIAEQTVSSGGAAVVAATMPLWVAVLGRLFGNVVTPREWASLVIGFVGVTVLMGGPSLAGQTSHIILLLCSPVCWALGSLLARRTRDIGGRHATLVGPALQMMTGGIVSFVIGVLRGEHWHAVPAEAYYSWAYLYLFGSVIGFTAFSYLLANARPVMATSYAYVNPVLAVLLGALLYGEPLGWTTVVANVLIVTAVMLVLRGPRTGVPTEH